MNDTFATPNKYRNDREFTMPPSPYLKTIGFGTGIRVYELTRSPLANKARSPWALKKIIKQKMNKELMLRLNWEAEILKKLNHPNIVGFRAHIKSSKGDVLAMEECTTSLGDLIEEKRNNGDITAYPVGTILKVGHGVSSALNYLHNEALILHSDIKSFNILVKNDFDVKLCDFGICLPLKKDGTIDERKVGKEFEYIGTPAWLAPEVKEFPQIVTTKADIYAFGIVLQEMLTLLFPITDDSSLGLDNLEFEIPEIDEEEYAIILEIKDKSTSFNLRHRPDAAELEHIFKDQLKICQNFNK